jgi:phospholipid transport system transporter-binding protein
VLALPSELTQIQATHCLGVLLKGLGPESGRVVTVDASALVQFDSAALAVLLEFRREVLAAGKGFMVQGIPPRLANLAVLYGVMDLLPEAASDGTSAH